jgi:hypothetical protein
MHALACLSALLLAQPAQPAAPRYMMEVQPAKRVEATLKIDIEAPKAKVTEWVLFVPRLPELAGQVNVKSKANYPTDNITDLGALKRPLLRSRIKVGKNKDLETKVTFIATYEAQLQTRKLVPLPEGMKPPKVAPLSAEERKLYLAKTEFINYDGDGFKAWLKDNNLKRAAGEADVDYGKRIFEFIVKNFQYDYQPKMDRLAASVCKDGKGDCGGLSIVFAAAMRGHGIPARLRVGRWAKSANAGEGINGIPYRQQHSWAEFYCQGIGWVPADPAVGVLFEKQGTSMEWFGYDHGMFLTLHLDHHVSFDTLHFGKHTEVWLQTGAYFLVGTGSVEGGTYIDDWQVREVK